MDIETGELPAWQWESLIDKPTKLVAITSASSAIGAVTDLRPLTKLLHEHGGTVVVDHSAAAPYRLIDINEMEADVLALNTIAWGGPPIGALVFRDPSTIESFSVVSLDPLAAGAERLEMGTHQFGMLAGVVASVEYLASLDEAATGTRRERLAVSMPSAAAYLDRLVDYLLTALRSLPLVTVIGQPESRIPVLSFVLDGVPAPRVLQRLADNGVLASLDTTSRVLDLIGGQRHRRGRHRGPCALHHDGRGGPAGSRAGVTRLIS